VALFADAMLHNFQAKLLERRIEPQRRAFHMAAFPARASRHSPLMPGQNGRRGHLPALDRRHLFCFPKGDNHANSMTKWNLRLTRSPM
jgi:hypothetical protein